ncbi:uncharacterized protein BJ212DRAFT_1376753, partial [Suillus subaureus]
MPSWDTLGRWQVRPIARSHSPVPNWDTLGRRPLRSTPWSPSSLVPKWDTL